MSKFLLGALCGVGVILLAAQAGAPPAQDNKPTVEEMREQLMLDATQPDTNSPDWISLSDEVGLMLQTDRHGVTVGWLWVRYRGGSWRPVAMAGFGDLAPGAVPAGER